MNRWKKITLIAVGTLAVLAVLIATALPIVIRNQAVKILRETTGRNVGIEKISLNPLTLTASVRGFTIEEKGGGPFLSIASLRASVSPASIYRRVLVLSEVAIDSPSLRVVRVGTDRFNFTDIVERQKREKPKPKPAGLFPFVLNDFHLRSGSLDLDDQAVAGGRKHSLRNLEIALPWLSSLPAEAQKQATPRISAIVNDAPLTLAGSVKPFSQDRDSSFHITLGKLSLPELAVYVPQAPPAELAAGKLTLDADLQYRQPPDGKPDLSAKGLVRLDTFDLNLPAGQPLLRLPALEVKIADLKPFAGLFAIEAITLEGPELFVSRDRRGEWMYQELLRPEKEKTTIASAEKTPKNSSAPPAVSAGAPSAVSVPRDEENADQIPKPNFSVASFALKNGRVHFRDDLPPGGFRADVEEIALNARNIANRSGQTGQYDLALRVDRETRLASEGTFAIAEPTAKVSARLTGLPLQKSWPYLAAYLTAPLQGIVDLSGEVAFSEKEGLIAEKGSLSLKNLRTRYGDGEGLALARLTIDDANFHQKENRLRIGRIKLSGGEVSLSRETDGKLSALSLLAQGGRQPSAEKGISPNAGRERPETKARPAVKPAAAKPEAAKPLSYRLKRLELDRLNFAFTDKTLPQKPRFTLRETNLVLADLNGPEPRPAKFRFASTFGKDASLKAAGNLTPDPFRYQGDLWINRLPVRDFEAYYPETLNFRIIGGLLDTTLALDVALKEGVATGRIRGDAGLGAFHAVDTVEEEDLLKWQRLQVDGIDCDLKPLRLDIGQVSVNEVYSRIIIREDGTVNLQDLIRKEEKIAGADKAAPVAAAAAETPKASAAGAAVIPPETEKTAAATTRIGTVTVLDGTVAFTDKLLPNDFETTFYNLGGRISGLTSEASLLADVDLRGNLENHSPLRISGKINPLREDLFVDLKISFSDIELSPMSPYTETYLGYILKQGKLFLDLSYHIADKKLVSENKIRIDQFTFGDKVESDKATSLPVKLGLALLKDHRGEIHLDVPVTGRLDDPKFNIWRIAFQVLKNLLVKAATAPFALLSSLFAGDGDLSFVAFAPGSDTLQPSEEKKLEALSKGLNERPALKVSLTAYADSDKDAEGYRNELLERKLKREKFLALTRDRQLAAGESAQTITLTAEERSIYLKAVYAKEKFPKPRNALGVEIRLPDAEMVKLILANTKVDKDELEDLTRERANAVKNYLIGKGKVAAERIFEKNDDIFKNPVKVETPRSRVELNALAS
ncbi:MAG: DUF748 domain-containing protein [Syntrophales bacterium]|nr:DUF748 domain-containing protein [Syntrophales bacterium]